MDPQSYASWTRWSACVGIFIGIIFVNSEAVLASHSSQREKRSAEKVVYGNHQNEARVKKAGPISPLDGVMDERSSEAPSTATDKVTDEKLHEVMQTMASPPIPPPSTQVAKEDVADLLSEKEDNSSKDDMPEKEQDDIIPKDNLVTQDSDSNDYMNYLDDYPDYYYYNSIYPGGRRHKRSFHLRNKAVMAEQMGGVSQQGRAKRDLFIYGGHAGGDRLSVRDSALASAYVRDMLAQPDSDYDDDGVNETTELQPELNYDLLEDVIKEEEEEQEQEELEKAAQAMVELKSEQVLKEKLRLYELLTLEKARLEQERENEVISKRNDEPAYKQLVYDGMPGIFIPIKRQYMSLVPGTRKRAPLYPNESAWGAMAARERRAEEERRAIEEERRAIEAERAEEEEEVERLLLLAEALQEDGRL